MAWQTSSRVWQHVKGSSLLNQNDRLMLLALAEKSDKDGICWPWFDTSYETLADMLGITRRSAIRIVEALCQAGLVVKIEATGRGKSNYYLVTAGLEQAEIDNHLAQIRSKRDDIDGPDNEKGDTGDTLYNEKGDTGDTLYNEKGDTGDTLLETKRVTQESPFTEKSDTGVTPPGLKESGLKESGYSPNGEGGLSPPASSKKSRASPKVELIPETPEQELVFRKWNQNRDAQGRSQQKYFRTIQQKQKCQQAGERLGLDRLGKALDQVLGNGATSFDHLINYIAKVNSNGSSSHEQQSQSQHRGKHRPKSWASRQRERDPTPA